MPLAAISMRAAPPESRARLTIRGPSRSQAQEVLEAEGAVAETVEGLLLRELDAKLG